MCSGIGGAQRLCSACAVCRAHYRASLPHAGRFSSRSRQRVEQSRAVWNLKAVCGRGGILVVAGATCTTQYILPSGLSRKAISPLSSFFSSTASLLQYSVNLTYFFLIEVYCTHYFVHILVYSGYISYLLMSVTLCHV